MVEPYASILERVQTYRDMRSVRDAHRQKPGKPPRAWDNDVLDWLDTVQPSVNGLVDLLAYANESVGLATWLTPHDVNRILADACRTKKFLRYRHTSPHPR